MLEIVEIPASERYGEDYRVTLNGRLAELYGARVSAMPYNCSWPGHQRPREQTELASFVHFSADESVVVEVTLKEPSEQATVRPLSAAVLPCCEGTKAVFTLTKPGAYTFEPYGTHRALHIFFHPRRDWGVDPRGEHVKYFGPGIHRPGEIRVESGDTVFLDAGAVVYGTVVGNRVHDVTVCGYGVLDGSEAERLEVYVEKNGFRSYDFERGCNGTLKFLYSTEIRVEGPILRDSAVYAASFWKCENVVIDNLKTIGMWRYNSDGIDLCNCANVLVKNCFLRNFDDCIAVKGVKFFDDRNVRNIRVESCVIWCDWGRSLEIGAETCADRMENILFLDCDCIHNAWAVLDIQNGDRGLVRNVRFENIRVEYQNTLRRWQFDTPAHLPYRPEDVPYLPPLMYAELYCNVFSNDGLLGENRDIAFADIAVLADEGLSMPPSVFRGADETHRTHRVTIENLSWNGRRLLSLAEANVNCGEFTDDIVLK